MSFSVTASVVSNQDATPISKVYPTLKGGVKRSYFGNLTLVATTVGQTMAFARVPARGRVNDVKVYTAGASMGNGSVKLGFYRPGGSVNTAVAVKDDAITGAMALTQTGIPVSVFNGPTATNKGKSISDWLTTEIGTASATSDVEFDIVATVVTVSTGTAVDLGFEIEMVLPE